LSVPTGILFAVHPLLACSETVVFDLDGTLVLSHIEFPRLRSAAIALADDVGYPIETLEGLDSLAISYRVSEWLPTAHREEFLRRAFEEFEAIEGEYADGVSLRKGALDLLRALDDLGLAVGIATRNSQRVAERMVRDTGLPIQVIVGRDRVYRVKPEPEHVWAVVDALGMPRRNLCVIGDHYMDVRAGKNVGAATVGVIPVGGTAEWFSPCPPDVIVSELTELIPE